MNPRSSLVLVSFLMLTVTAPPAREVHAAGDHAATTLTGTTILSLSLALIGRDGRARGIQDLSPGHAGQLATG
jgi:hypothetical protein